MCCLPLFAFAPINYMIPQNTYLPWDSYKLQLTGALNSQGMFSTNPQIAYQQGCQYGAELAQAIIDKTRIQTNVTNLVSGINSLKASIDTALASDKVSREQKEQLKLLKERLQEIETKIQKLQGQNVSAEVDALLSEFNDIKGMVTEIANQIKNDLGNNNTDNTDTNNNNGNTNNTGNTDNTNNTGNTNNAGNASETGNSDETGNTDSTDGDSNTTSGTKKNYSSPEARAWAEALYSSGKDRLFGWGTDDETFETLIGNLSGDNVIEAISAFENAHGDFGLFVGSEAEHYQKKRVFKHIVLALQDRAEQAGVVDKIAPDVKAIYDELDDCVIGKKLINEHIKSIVQTIKTAENK